MTKLSREAQLALSEVASAHQREVNAKATIRNEIETQFRSALLQVRMEKSVAAWRALKAGAPKTAIGRAMGTSSFNTISSILAISADQFINVTDMPPLVFSTELDLLTVNWWDFEGTIVEGPATFTYSWAETLNKNMVDWRVDADNPFSRYIQSLDSDDKPRIFSEAGDKWDEFVAEALGLEKPEAESGFTDNEVSTDGFEDWELEA